MPALTEYARQRILQHYLDGHAAPTIRLLLRKENIFVSRVSVWKFLCHYKKSGTLLRKPGTDVRNGVYIILHLGSGRPSKVTPEVKVIVDRQMLYDDETTAYQIHRLLKEKGYDISIWTIFRCRKELGWTFRGSAYCQLIRTANKEKRLTWAREYLDEAEDGFDNVIFTDESSIQLETHKRFCFRKKGCAPKNKPR